MQVVAFGLSDVGKKRERNEDSLLIAPDLQLFVIADGMGGHQGGAVASHLAVESIESVIRNNIEVLESHPSAGSLLEHSSIAQLFSDAFREACRVVHEKSLSDPTLTGMGTTTTGLLIHDSNAYIAHVGDSRIYLLRGDVLTQLSEDHSLVYDQLRAGLITPSQARNSRFRNVITRSIGFEPDVDVDMIALPSEPNDIFLLCTDGLNTMLNDEEIAQVLSSKYVQNTPATLVELANQRGGDDNISVICVQVLDDCH